jgi:hypothetical protein
MFNWRELLQSKKFKVMAASVIGLIAMSLAEHGTVTVDALDALWKIVSAYLLSQGAADVGKHFADRNPGPLPPSVGDAVG